MLRALKYRNYRLFFGGQIVSLVGTWITTTATSWLVYRLTGSAVLLGVVGFAGEVPPFSLRTLARLRRPAWRRRLRWAVPRVSPRTIRRPRRRSTQPPPAARRHADGLDASVV